MTFDKAPIEQPRSEQPGYGHVPESPMANCSRRLRSEELGKNNSDTECHQMQQKSAVIYTKNKAENHFMFGNVTLLLEAWSQVLRLPLLVVILFR